MARVAVSTVRRFGSVADEVPRGNGQRGGVGDRAGMPSSPGACSAKAAPRPHADLGVKRGTQPRSRLRSLTECPHDDLRSLDLRGFSGVIVRWATADGRQSSYLPQNMARERVLDVLGEDLRSRVEKLVVAERQGLVDVYRSWGDRYETSLMDLERQSEAAAARLGARLDELGHT